MASSVRAHYTAGKVEGKEIPSYHDAEGVDPERGVETFAQIDLPIDNWRWGGRAVYPAFGESPGAKSAGDPHPVPGCTVSCFRKREAAGAQRPPPRL